MATAKNNKVQPPATKQNFPIVGIGASAGGLDAFKKLLSAIPESSGMAYVLVQHLDPSHESMLPEILQRVTKIPVHEITEDMHLAPEHIYIIPSNKILTSTDGVLQLAPRDKKILNLSIDIFFTSLAEVHKEFAIGVILSGTGKDGTEGLKAIKEHGGISIAQDMESAAYDGMPESAINAGVVDFILAPEKIPEQLLQINSAYKTSRVFTKEKPPTKDEEAVFEQIISQLRQSSGVDFTHYKDPTLRRRIARRLAIAKEKNMADYLKFLRSDKDEQDALFQDMLIPVTSFFRDPKTFQALTETVFPSILKHKNPDAPIRMWIAGCSTGEEVYSIAICLQEFLGANSDSYRDRTKIQIFASDISEKAIKKARAGIYTTADVEGLSASQLETYFTKNNGGYEVSKSIRDMCVIAPHNFLKDPPFAKIDLICCRNVLIYMDSFLQQKAFATFHYALKENGFLLLGKSESVGASSDLFAQVVKKEKIYSRKRVAGRFRRGATELKEEVSTRKIKNQTKQEATQTDFKKSAEAIMIAKAPASVVVNEQLDIVHIHGDISPFLETPQGQPTHHLLSMARDGLSFELRNAIHKASKDKIAVTTEHIPLKINAPVTNSNSDREGQGKQTLVVMEIIPMNDTVERHYLIRFEKTIVANVKDEKSASSGKTKAAEALKRNKQLEKELEHNREDMRAITQDMEAANEELQSANEELQSSNEEMQSLNEELETSKEELQSTNEELIIINRELFENQEQLSAARLYSDSIVSTMRHPLIVLDKNLLIKTANAAFYEKFKVDEKEIEKKWFYEIQHRQFDDVKLRSLLVKVLSQRNRIDDFEIVLKLPKLGARTLSLNARQVNNENTDEQLILLAIEDVTEQVAAQKIIDDNKKRTEKERKLLHDFFTQAPAVLAILKGPEHVFEFANEAYMEFVGNRNLKDRSVLDALPETAGQGFIELLDTVYKTGETYNGKELSLKLDKGTGEFQQFYMNFIYQALRNDKDEIEGILVYAHDVTEQVMARKLIEASEKRFSNILEQSIMAIGILKGTDMVISFANAPLLETWGKGDDVFGKPFFEVMPEIKDQGFPELLDQVYTTGVPYYGHETEVTHIRNGKEETRYYNFVYQPYTEVDNSITGITILATDVTEQVLAKKQIEESENEQLMLARLLKLATDSAAVGIWSLDVDSSKLKWSNIHKKLWGYDEHREDLTYQDWHSVIVPKDKKMAFQKIEASKENHDIYEVDYRITRANDGAVVWMRSTGQYHYDEFGKAHTLSGISIDITEHKSFTEALEVKVKQRTAALKKSNEELKKTNTQLDQFAHVASHDLQEPLRKILTFSMRLQDDHKAELSKEVKFYLDKIEGASARMSTLIRELLNYSRLLGHEKSVVQTNLNATLKNVLKDFELLVEEKKALINFDELPSIEAIPLQMNQLFYNLISNALKFSREEVPPVINITSRTLSDKQVKKHPTLNPSVTYVEIRFKDNGIGFDQKYSEKIFTIFQRLHNRDTFIGTGIGLALIKKITENHQGLTFAAAKEHKGATFHVILPVKQS
ncbi:PAS domain S-box protein [Subsaximicrobium wynnwilliamsii]|uniref:PAS domain S-box protein n=1 Tax=Subsaximicrobium wynnwilliamsii TaxID=291179 RepID=A0A5C6ZRQ7_9FLAO|nr:chemotaxis protein CheB [Subsaximicrobium wynnwilliamsii]TXD85227.1 PAS domain S-box protein [Subsaximicrobium wynnwilliamsii]TXD91270.1 PAS domain S-box protein [Subsaximicrobium wynnwilliamsii]TXE04663.1 PAS domain S-box protein [Subsaximicrobium wynnwilliamsii]